MLGIAAGREPTWQFIDGLLGLRSDGYMLKRAGSPDRPLPIPDAYNQLARACLESGCEWLLNVNDDCLLHAETLDRLLGWGAPIVAPLAFTRRDPIMPMVYSGRAGDKPNGYRIPHEHVTQWLKDHPALCTNSPAALSDAPGESLYEITEGFLSTHCLLVHREVLETVPEPWFHRLTRPGDVGTGCDRFFSEQATKHGYTLHVDMSQQVGHLRGGQPVGALSYLAWNAITVWQDHRYEIGANGHG